MSQNGEEKPAVRWSFEIVIGGESQPRSQGLLPAREKDLGTRLGESGKKLFDFIIRLREGFGISDRYSQLKISKFEVTISMNNFSSDSKLSKGMII